MTAGVLVEIRVEAQISDVVAVERLDELRPESSCCVVSVNGVALIGE